MIASTNIALSKASSSSFFTKALSLIAFFPAFLLVLDLGIGSETNFRLSRDEFGIQLSISDFCLDLSVYGTQFPLENI